MSPVARQFEEALRIIRALRAARHEAYLAGGCVRDLLLGRPPADFDVATSATPDVVLEMFERTFAVGAHFGVVLVAPEDPEAGFVTEVATFRSDGAYSDGRHPDAVRYTLNAEEDVRRRDFTINGLLLDPERLSAEGSSAQTHPSHKNKDVPAVEVEDNARTEQAAEKLDRRVVPGQGTTLVVPQMQQNKGRALAPAEVSG
ncbi:MAG: hypothetical protein ACRD3N_01835, partial [Terracidiphilus sp.]